MEAFCVSTSSRPRAKGYKKCFHSGVPNPAYYQDKLVHLKQNQKKEGKEGKKKGRKRKEGKKRNNTKSPCRFLDSLWKIEGLCWILEIYIWVSMPTPTTSLSQVILMKTQVGSHDFIYSILSKAAAYDNSDLPMEVHQVGGTQESDSWPALYITISIN